VDSALPSSLKERGSMLLASSDQLHGQNSTLAGDCPWKMISFLPNWLPENWKFLFIPLILASNTGKSS